MGDRRSSCLSPFPKCGRDLSRTDGPSRPAKARASDAAHEDSGFCGGSISEIVEIVRPRLRKGALLANDEAACTDKVSQAVQHS